MMDEFLLAKRRCKKFVSTATPGQARALNRSGHGTKTTRDEARHGECSRDHAGSGSGFHDRLYSRVGQANRGACTLAQIKSRALVSVARLRRSVYGMSAPGVGPDGPIQRMRP